MIDNLIDLYIFITIILCIFGIGGVVEYITDKVSEMNDERLRKKYHFTYSIKCINDENYSCLKNDQK